MDKGWVDGGDEPGEKKPGGFKPCAAHQNKCKYYCADAKYQASQQLHLERCFLRKKFFDALILKNVNYSQSDGAEAE